MIWHLEFKGWLKFYVVLGALHRLHKIIQLIYRYRLIHLTGLQLGHMDYSTNPLWQNSIKLIKVPYECNIVGTY